MEIEWETLLSAQQTGYKKFEELPTPPPWTQDMDDNLRITVEWLYREGKNFESRFYPEDLLVAVTDNWFKNEKYPGHFVHLCYPNELMSFRRKYECLFDTIKHSLKDPDPSLNMKTQCAVARNTLWAGWACLGTDGVLAPPPLTREEECAGGVAHLKSYDEWVFIYNNKCDRCSSNLPKGLQIWVKLQHGKLSSR